VVFNFSADTQFHGNILPRIWQGISLALRDNAGLTANRSCSTSLRVQDYRMATRLMQIIMGNDAPSLKHHLRHLSRPERRDLFRKHENRRTHYGGDSVNMQIVSGDTITLPTQQVPDVGFTMALLSLSLGFVVAAKKKLLTA
jgi:hypothetical protein